MLNLCEKVSQTRMRRRISAEEIHKRERLKIYLTQKWGIKDSAAKSFARKHARLSFEDVIQSVENLARYFRNYHTSHYGFILEDPVLNAALNHTLLRFARSQKPLTEKQLGYFLQLAKDEISSQLTSRKDPGTEEERARLLTPLKQALFYEEDAAMRQRLLFIYSLFVKQGMRITKKRVISECTTDEALFPRRRVVEDALETLRGAYEALGLIRGELFITPEYLLSN